MKENQKSNKDKLCLFCLEEMEPAFPNARYEPEGGGQVIFVFRFGSKKFDEAPGQTQYHGVVCDACAERLVDRMERVMFNQYGKVWEVADAEKTRKAIAFWQETLFGAAIKAPAEPPGGKQGQKIDASTLVSTGD